MITYTETYNKITQESAEQGDYSEHGFMLDGWEYALDDSEGYHEDILEQSRHGDFKQKASLGDVIRKIRNDGLQFNGSWFESMDDEIDYRTGEHKQHALHIDDKQACNAVALAIKNNVELI